MNLSREISALVLLVVLLTGATSDARVRAPKIELGPTVVRSLDLVMEKADQLRAALVEKNEPQVITRKRALSLVLGEAMRVSDPDSRNKKHLDLILKDAKAALDKTTSGSADERRALLQQVFKQIVLIGQTYKFKEDIKIYFCRQDRSVWVQKAGKPQNPVNPDSLLNCAILVR